MLALRDEIGFYALLLRYFSSFLVDRLTHSLYLCNHFPYGKSSRVFAIGPLKWNERGYEKSSI
jgi:hypothetical protein